MLVTGIKKKDEIILSQPSIALPGFVDAIQLVFMAAVPQIKEIVPQVEPVVVIESDSESDSALSDAQAEEEAEQTDPQTVTPPAVVRYCINPNHVKVMDEEAKVTHLSKLMFHM